MKLAQDVGTIFGKVTPPPGAYNDNPAAGLAKLLAVSIRLFFIVAAMTMLFYLLWGGYDWVMSGGDKEKLEQARGKITNAILGLFIVIASLTIFTYVAGNLLGIIDVGNGFRFTLPTLQDIP